MADQSSRKRLAIVSSYEQFCGIAAYARRLAHYLSADFDITVFPLDQTLLRGTTKQFRRHGNQHIGEIAAQLGEYDAVNIQYEPGTLASSPGLAVRRLFRLLDASRAYSVTFHTFARNEGIPFGSIAGDLGRLRVRQAVLNLKQARHDPIIGHRVFTKLRTDSRHKPVSFIVHTKREAKHLKIQYGVERVFDHPLSFLTRADVERARHEASRDRFSALADLPPDARVIGTFGFISPYKGTLTAVQALRSLPENYHLAIFGGLHPNEIRKQEESNLYLRKVIEGVAGFTQLDLTKHEGLEKIALESIQRSNIDLSDRVHFMGAPDDDEFIAGMALSDVVVLPYLEVGQTSSGPISMAIELRRPIVAARNHAFRQLARYHPDRFDFFEIGNHLELAQRILHPLTSPRLEAQVDYRTNRATYRAAHDLSPELAEAETERRAPERVIETRPEHAASAMGEQASLVNGGVHTP